MYVFMSEVSYVLNDNNSTSSYKKCKINRKEGIIYVVTAEGNTMPEPRKTEFSPFSMRSGTVISANKVVSGNMFFVPSVRRDFFITVTGNTCF
jgi:hypothetical protein